MVVRSCARLALVTILGVMIVPLEAAFLIPSKTTAVEHHHRRSTTPTKTPSSLSSRMKDDGNFGVVEKWASRTAASIALATGLVFGIISDPNGVPSSPITIPMGIGGQEITLFSNSMVANAAVAPLADVGLREFLVKDGNEFLRLSLPTSLPTATEPSELGDTGREVQEAVELVRLRLEQVGFSGKTPVWSAANKEVNKALFLVKTPDMLKGIPEAKLTKAKQLVDLSEEKLKLLGEVVRKQDIVNTLALQEECSSLVYDIRSLSMKEGVLPYQIPDEFATLPQLRGRAIVECTLAKGKGMYKVGVDEEKMSQVTLTLTVDGYHAPITAGNFIDLVQRKFYDNMPIQSAEELIVQTGKPIEGTTDGFVDPKTKEKRVIPLEIFYKKDKEPTYSYTSDDDMRATESMSLPFQAYGALGMAHDPEDVNTASSQFWFLKWDQALVAPSRNTLDGSQACFGYVTKNQDVLKQLSKGDTIISMKVVQGAENFFVKK